MKTTLNILRDPAFQNLLSLISLLLSALTFVLTLQQPTTNRLATTPTTATTPPVLIIALAAVVLLVIVALLARARRDTDSGRRSIRPILLVIAAVVGLATLWIVLAT
ncbi:MAG: hypothetical protein GYB67_17630 [Chloroflexi bacterium]|nr:hypothetical protein [Chloroflexota bacterium]